MKRWYRNSFIIIAFIGNLIFGIKGHAQTFTIPDANFRQFLKDSFPTVLDAQDRLIIASAASVTKQFNATSKNISDVNGVQYFTSIRRLNLDRNKLTSLPDLSPITQLQELSLIGNPLGSLQPMQVFTELRILRCDSCNLSTFPSLAGMTKLYRVFCRYNNLTAVPDVSGCTSLFHLLCSRNEISSLPDFSTNIALGNFSAEFNKISVVHNYASLPFSIFTCRNNQLTFEDLLLLAKHPAFDANFNYKPQDSIEMPDKFVFVEKDTPELYLGFDDTVTTNMYYWYKNNNLIAATPVNKLKISPPIVGTTDRYFCKIKNMARASWADWEIVTQGFDVTVVPCLYTDNLDYTLLDSDCKKGFTIELKEDKITNGQLPFVYKLYNKTNGDTLYYNSKILENVDPGYYDLIIKDQQQCERTVKNFITIQNQAKCDVVITPDDDGKNDQYFIDTPGKIKIYNVNGILIKSMNGPAYWNGANNQGELVPMGLYAIIVDEKDITNITVIY